ncbi:MAG: VRR-NUC domain-containing protein [Pseudomonadota bacterium]
MSEQDLQYAVVDWLDLAIDAKLGFFWATPNETGVGGKRGKMLGAIRKRMGVRPGMPDIMVAHTEVSHPVGIELKTAKGRQTDNQKAIQARFEALGWPYYVCRSVDQVQDALEGAGVPLRVQRLPL